MLQWGAVGGRLVDNDSVGREEGAAAAVLLGS